MSATITFFPVGNGDMTLIRLADPGQMSILIDVNIRKAADAGDDETRDVAKDLRARLKYDDNGRPYVDVFLLSHPDKDHCTGLIEHFYLGPIADYPDDGKDNENKRIIIREIWSSPMVFRRASNTHTLCDDAKALNKEAKRRIEVNVSKKFVGVDEGDQILIMGEDQEGKTDNLTKILIKAGDKFNRVNMVSSQYIECHLLGPMPVQEHEDEEGLLSKNHSSVIINFKIAASSACTDGCRFLTCGDAEFLIWEKLWNQYNQNTDALMYDLLQAPHHCSWHSLSDESWSDSQGKASVSDAAVSALSQTRGAASIVSSSNAINDDYNDPPCFGAKREYKKIIDKVGGAFYCTGEFPCRNELKPLEFEISVMGLALKNDDSDSAATIVSSRAPRAG